DRNVTGVQTCALPISSNFDLLYSWLESDLRMVNNFESADFYFDSYKDRIECNEYGGDYVKTLFGVKWQTHYMGDAFWAGCEVREDRKSVVCGQSVVIR